MGLLHGVAVLHHKHVLKLPHQLVVAPFLVVVFVEMQLLDFA
jgi:hypothetical protein